MCASHDASAHPTPLPHDRRRRPGGMVLGTRSGARRPGAGSGRRGDRWRSGGLRGRLSTGAGSGAARDARPRRAPVAARDGRVAHDAARGAAAVRARSSGQFRWLARPRQCGLGLYGRAAGLQAPRALRSRGQCIARRRRSALGDALLGPAPGASRVPDGLRAERLPSGFASRLQWPTVAERRGLLPEGHPRRPATHPRGGVPRARARPGQRVGGVGRARRPRGDGRHARGGRRVRGGRHAAGAPRRTRRDALRRAGAGCATADALGYRPGRCPAHGRRARGRRPRRRRPQRTRPAAAAPPLSSAAGAADVASLHCLRRHVHRVAECLASRPADGFRGASGRRSSGVRSRRDPRASLLARRRDARLGQSRRGAGREPQRSEHRGRHDGARAGAAARPHGDDRHSARSLSRRGNRGHRRRPGRRRPAGPGARRRHAVRTPGRHVRDGAGH